jgi:hypothetical protein
VIVCVGDRHTHDAKARTIQCLLSNIHWLSYIALPCRNVCWTGEGRGTRVGLKVGTLGYIQGLASEATHYCVCVRQPVAVGSQDL